MNGIYPTWRGVVLMAAGAPVAVAAAAAVDPALWKIGLGWVLIVAVALMVDGLLAPSRRSVKAEAVPPHAIEAGSRGGEMVVTCSGRARRPLDLIVETNALLTVEPERQVLAPDTATARLRLLPRRRGHAVLEAIHLRWRGPFGLVFKQKRLPLDRRIDVVPHVSAVREEALRLFSRTRNAGSVVQNDLAQSMEFHALREFQRGDDSRSVSWRQSARHMQLLVRETRAERNRTIQFAFDTGRLMCEPLEGGLPRIDHALNAALLMAYVGLKLGDKVGLYAFDSRPGPSSGLVSGIGAFAPLQRLAATLDYSTEETNHTFGLTRLAATLGSRALIVIFTEFADSTGAALMVDNVGRLLERHLVLFVAFQDAEMEAMVRADPTMPADVSRAVVAAGLLREREVVIGKLKRLGVEVLDVPARSISPALLGRYLALKREDRL